jgi:hypothetical protein
MLLQDYCRRKKRSKTKELIMLKKPHFIISILMFGVLFAQNPADLAQSEAIQESQESIDQNEAEDSPAFPIEVLTEMVEERLDRKGKILAEVNDDGSIYMIGAATTIKAMNQSGFITSRRIAFEKAELQAKIAIIRLSGETITSERGMETLDQFTDGIDPDLTKKATFMQKLMTVADKSADAALKLLGTTDEELAAMNQGEKDILLKEDFASRSASIVSSMLSGCTTYKILEGDAGGDDYQVAVCVKYTPELRKLAAIVERDVKYQLDPKKAKNSFSKIKDMPVEKLMMNLGSKVMFNNQGQMVVFGFGQKEFRGSRKRASAAYQRAKSAARLEAATAIKNFVAEDLVSEEMTETIEKYREYADSTEAAFQSEKWEQKIQAKSTTLKNLSTSTVREWRGKHPLSGHDVAGVVVAWSPQGAQRGRDLRESLSEEVDLDEGQKAKEKDERKKTKKSKFLGDDWDDDD